MVNVLKTLGDAYAKINKKIVPIKTKAKSRAKQIKKGFKPIQESFPMGITGTLGESKLQKRLEDKKKFRRVI